jgi:cytoskeletal protein RodZ
MGVSGKPAGDRDRVVMTKLRAMILLGALAAATGPVLAQQATDAEKTPAAAPAQNSTPASNVSSEADDAAATAALIAKANAAAAKAASSASTKATNDASVAKKAREAGWRPEAHNGETVYCRDDPTVGSRFSTRRCVHENQLLDLLQKADYDRDMIRNSACSGGGACTPSK